MLKYNKTWFSVGALTNKITAFAYRPWDLHNIQFRLPDQILSFGNMPTKVMRILKTISLSRQDYWITDVDRFSLDALSRQRLTKSYDLTNKNNYFYNTHLLGKTAILGCGINRTLFDFIYYRVDNIMHLNRNRLLNILPSYIPLKACLSEISNDVTSNKCIFLILNDVLKTDITLKTKLTLIKNDPNFEFFVFGSNLLPWIKNLGITSLINQVFNHKVGPLYNNLDDVENATLVVIADHLCIPLQAIYDYSASLSVNIKVHLISRELTNIYRYSPFFINFEE